MHAGIYTYLHIYMYVYTHTYICIFVYIARARRGVCNRLQQTATHYNPLQRTLDKAQDQIKDNIRLKSISTD